MGFLQVSSYQVCWECHERGGGMMQWYWDNDGDDNIYRFLSRAQMFSCDVCNIHLKGRIQYEDHLKRKKHARMIKHLKKTSEILSVYENNLKSRKESNPSNIT